MLKVLRRFEVKPNLKKLAAAAFGAAVLLAATIVVFSQQPQAPPPAPGPGFGFGGPRGLEGAPGPGFRDVPGLGPLAQELNLTDDQKAQIQKIAESSRENEKALHEEMKTLLDSHPNPMNSEFNEAAVRAAAEARAKIQVEMEVSHARMMSQIAGVLTAEQKAQLAARREEMRHTGPPAPPPLPGVPPF
jgi:Spy/CpxP family protein refolding chaperone